MEQQTHLQRQQDAQICYDALLKAVGESIRDQIIRQMDSQNISQDQLCNNIKQLKVIDGLGSLFNKRKREKNISQSNIQTTPKRVRHGIQSVHQIDKNMSSQVPKETINLDSQTEKEQQISSDKQQIGDENQGKSIDQNSDSDKVKEEEEEEEEDEDEEIVDLGGLSDTPNTDGRSIGAATDLTDKEKENEEEEEEEIVDLGQSDVPNTDERSIGAKTDLTDNIDQMDVDIGTESNQKSDVKLVDSQEEEQVVKEKEIDQNQKSSSEFQEKQEEQQKFDQKVEQTEEAVQVKQVENQMEIQEVELDNQVSEYEETSEKLKVRQSLIAADTEVDVDKMKLRAMLVDDADLESKILALQVVFGEKILQYIPVNNMTMAQ
eukprot:TRINITY_DN10223_c1_g1_i1.p1 TRINITY_DN10223_c1_g1~~TRINITY_DN10223_c1_g1_i1.p1  ORF type:complete len:420 (-),score=71.45 TRINITY_DN10223_c1_g1_i1:367-1497(-)